MSSAITIAAVGTGISAYGAYSASQAAGKAGAAQEGAAQDFQTRMQQQEQQALSGMQTPSQMAAYDSALKSQQAQVSRLQSLASSLDPTLVEAGKQTAALLQGKSAPVLGEIQNQRAVQRQQLQNDLTAKYGAGAMSSGIGLQQLQKFDLDTSNMMNSVQQQYLSQVSGIAINGPTAINDAISKANQTLSTIQTQSPGEEAAKVMASFQSGNAAAGEAVVNSAGGQYAGDAALGQGLVGVGSGVATLGGAIGGYNRANSTTPGTTTGADPTGTLDGATKAQTDAYAKAQGGAPAGSLAATMGPPAPGMAAPQKSAGIGIPSAYNGPLSPGYTGYSGPSQYMDGAAYRPMNLGQAFQAGMGGPSTGNIVGGQ